MGASLRMAAGLAAWLVMLFAGTAFAQEYQTALQVSPQGGGNCIEVPNRDFVRDQGLQMKECDSSAAQIFTYDPANARLTIGGLCVDANGGKPGDLVKLWSCDGGANQAWKAEQKGNFTKLVGQNGLCLDIRYGSKEVGAPLQSWNCGEAEPNQLWIFQRE
jgi:alpha-galactosidase